MSDWQPSAALDVLRARAQLFDQLRQFFRDRGVLEVETPLLAQATVTEPAIDAFSVPVAPNSADRFLQTSPEYAMKRLLAAGAGDLFQICKAFRRGEAGSRHNPEFTLLEWYRCGMDHRQLIREVAELLCEVLECPGWQVWPYRSLFTELLGLDPFSDSIGVPELQRAAQTRLGDIPDGLDRDALLDLLMSHCIEPEVAQWGVVFVTDFPLSQAALARQTQVNGLAVAARFEVWVDGLEVANGYWEEPDAKTLRHRFAHDQRKRVEQGKSPVAMDERLLAAHQYGLPDCAGVALGVDRLLARKLGLGDIRTAVSFGWDSA